MQNEHRWDIVARAMDIFEKSFEKRTDDESWNKIMGMAFQSEVTEENVGTLTKKAVEEARKAYNQHFLSSLSAGEASP